MLLYHSNRKLRKSSSELADKMDALSLNELSSTESKTSTEQRLAQLENIFSFPTADSSSFPKNHCQEFIQQLQHLPQGNVVNTVLMSVAKWVYFPVGLSKHGLHNSRLTFVQKLDICTPKLVHILYFLL